ncbi:molybdenum cofactor cytidylyltransferase [Chloroflexota bacterium]
MISAILLAAGESKRMGQLKQLMPLGQSTIIEQAIDALLNSAVSESIVVLGHRAEEVIKAIAAKPVKIAINPNYQQGMSTSIIAGLNVIDSRAQAVMLALGDQPFIDSQAINSLMEAFDAHNKGIAIPVCRGRRGHPVIFASRYKGELLKLKGDIGGREIIDRHPDDVLEVAVNCEGICVDIDTMDNYTEEK